MNPSLYSPPASCAFLWLQTFTCVTGRLSTLCLPKMIINSRHTTMPAMRCWSLKLTAESVTICWGLYSLIQHDGNRHMTLIICYADYYRGSSRGAGRFTVRNKGVCKQGVSVSTVLHGYLTQDCDSATSFSGSRRQSGSSKFIVKASGLLLWRQYPFSQVSFRPCIFLFFVHVMLAIVGSLGVFFPEYF